MIGLYRAGYRPVGLPRRYEATSVSITGEGQAADVMRRYGAPRDFGDPVDAVAFWGGDGDLRAMTCDYANGRRVELRIRRAGSSIAVTTTPKAPADGEGGR